MINKKNTDSLPLMKSAMSAFRISSEILAKTGEATIKGEGGVGLKKIGVGTTISSIVLYAFSCEIGFKALMEKEEIKIVRTHDLNKLFGKLPIDMRGRIKKEVMARNREGGDDDFETLLDNNSKAFEQWRYFYDHERVSASIGFLKNLSAVISQELER